MTETNKYQSASAQRAILLNNNINYRQRDLNALRVLKAVRIIKLLDPQFEKGIFPLADRLENQ